MADQAEPGWPALPTETEIYILPNGEIVVADLPAELAESMQALANLSSPTAGEAASTRAASLETFHVTD